MKIHILMKIIVEGYYNRYYTPMIDTGAEVNICKYNCLPNDKQIKLKTPIIVKGFNNEGSMINYKAKDIKIQIWNKILKIDEIYNYDLPTKDMILGIPFLDKYYPHILTKTHWWLIAPCNHKVGAKRVYNKIRKNAEWIKGSESINKNLENMTNTSEGINYIIFTIDKLSPIKQRLEKLYSEDPLKGWNKHKTIVKQN